MLWFEIAGALAFIIVLAFIAPARVSVMIDTATATATADMRLLWGLGPKLTFQATKSLEGRDLIALFGDAPRIGEALMTPGIVDVVLTAVKQMFQLKPQVANVALGLNLNDGAKDLVVQTAAQAALALSPEAVRKNVTVSKSAAPGVELVARFDANASPLRVQSIYDRLRKSNPAKEFRRRLRRKPKKRSKPPRQA